MLPPYVICITYNGYFQNINPDHDVHEFDVK